ncbi:MAG: hypothetical protein AAF439_16210 [Pseudomonadota bacterium]
MILRILGLILAAVIGLILWYLSPFWPFDWWGREGLFGLQDLRPGGDLLSRWLRGTMFAPFDVLIWIVGAFLVLTWVQNGLDWLKGR